MGRPKPYRCGFVDRRLIDSGEWNRAVRPQASDATLDRRGDHASVGDVIGQHLFQGRPRRGPIDNKRVAIAAVGHVFGDGNRVGGAFIEVNGRSNITGAIGRLTNHRGDSGVNFQVRVSGETKPGDLCETWTRGRCARNTPLEVCLQLGAAYRYGNDPDAGWHHGKDAPTADGIF